MAVPEGRQGRFAASGRKSPASVASTRGPPTGFAGMSRASTVLSGTKKRGPGPAAAQQVQDAIERSGRELHGLAGKAIAVAAAQVSQGEGGRAFPSSCVCLTLSSSGQALDGGLFRPLPTRCQSLIVLGARLTFDGHLKCTPAGHGTQAQGAQKTVLWRHALSIALFILAPVALNKRLPAEGRGAHRD